MAAMQAAEPESITAEPPSLPWPAPLGIALTDVTFLHWPVERAQVSPLLPPGTEPDTFDGTTYVGLVAFRMRSYGEFLQTNVRVYSVDGKGRRGTVFLSMECDRLPWVLAARAGWFPYAWSRMSLGRSGHVLTYTSTRRWPDPGAVRTRVRVRVGQPVDGTPFEHFLTARWRLHHAVPGITVIASLSHDRWPLYTADLLDFDDHLIAATGLPAPTTAPASVLYAPNVHGRIGLTMPA